MNAFFIISILCMALQFNLPISAELDIYEKPLITCNLKNGQFGNQLFQIAALLAYSWDHDATAVFPDLNETRARLSYNRDRFFFNLDASSGTRPFTNVYQEPTWHSADPIPFQNDLYVVGYLQSWRHFHHYRERILAAFSAPEEMLDYLHSRFSDLIYSDKTVCVNVRTYSASSHQSKRFPFLGLQYYLDAMELFPEDSIFVVFSDRIEWCKHTFPQLGKNFVFIDGTDHIEDLILMSLMNHHILANSTLAWWGAYLNKKSDKIVIAPENWMHPDIEKFPPPQPNDFYLPEWIVIPNSFDAPYPHDMRWYDKQSQSDDGDI